MLFQRNKLQLPKLNQKSHVNWYLEQFWRENSCKHLYISEQ